MGGKKRKITKMAKIERKDSRAVTFSKRRNGLYSKTADLCLLSGAQVAILATPVTSNSNVSFYSFGNSSVDSVVSAFLSDQNPNPNCENMSSLTSKKGHWWEDESLLESESSEELSDAVDAISNMLQSLKGLHSVKNQEDLKKKKDQEGLGHHKTLDLKPSTSASQVDSSLIAFTEKNEEDEDGLLGPLDEFSLDEIFDLVRDDDLWFGSDNNGEDGALVVTHRDSESVSDNNNKL